MPYRESEFENAFIKLLEAEGWQYLYGTDIPRSSDREVLCADDMEKFLNGTNPDLTADEIHQIIDIIRLSGAGSDFATLHKNYNYLVGGITFTPQDSKARIIELIDFDNPEKNIFHAVSQFSVEYYDNGHTATRRPDILLFINGIPLCIIELKNPADKNATIYDAWKQIYIRYWRDIPHLLHYCPLACISDGVNTRLGTVRTPYEHFYSWRRVNENDKVSTLPFDELKNMISGVFEPKRFLEIFRDYIYFQDSEYDSEEIAIICRYPQFFATRLLKQSIITAVTELKDGKGGTYFGATGCGKTYTMAFLARQLALRCPELGSPTIVMIVDRDDLQQQGARLFTKSKEFLNIGEVNIVNSRDNLRHELGARESGGFYICTIQKFCDRQSDKIGLINGRRNIICFSDEAHRTQLEHSRKIQFSRDENENVRAIISKPYAKVLREAFPNAVYVGFTGTPIAETYQTFGEEIDRYTMDQAVADGLTVPIKYHPRIARVLLDDKKAAEIEAYYKKCADDGATQETIEASKRAMSSMEIILGEPERLERLAGDIHDHYSASCANDPERVQKAMIVCSNRKIAYDLLKVLERKYPEWFEERKTCEDLKSMPFIAMIASVGSNDEKEMHDYFGGADNEERSKIFDAAFKNEKSNFHIAIVVDMWLTGFDVPSLTYMYNDKPLKRHMLIQTISRVNRKYPGKDFGFIIDYIGIRDNMREAMKIYGGDVSIAHSEDDVRQAADLFREEISILKNLFSGYDLTPFIDERIDPVERYRLLTEAAEYVFISTQELKVQTQGIKTPDTVPFKIYFLKSVKRMRKAYDICQPSGVLDNSESSLAQCLMAVAGIVRKMNGTSEIDTDIMNRNVKRMVEDALKYNEVENIFDDQSEENIFSTEYFESLSNIRMPATKLELLIKILRQAITAYSRTNQIAAKRFKDMLENTIKQYHERRLKIEVEKASITQEAAVNKIIENAMEQALKILQEMKIDRESFRKIGLTFEEKTFYDILIALRDNYKFEYGEDIRISDEITVNDKCKKLACKIKEIIDLKSAYSDWLNNQIIREQLKFDIKVCLIKNGYPPQYSPEVFRKIMEQIENFKENKKTTTNLIIETTKKENLQLPQKKISIKL